MKKCELPIGGSLDGVYAAIRRLLVLPETPQLSKQDLPCLIIEFCESHSMPPPMNVTSRLTPAHNRCVQSVEKELDRVRAESLRRPNVLHYFVTTEHNMEAMCTIDVLLQLGKSMRDGTPTVVVGKHMLHACTYMNGAELRHYDVKKRDKFTMMLKSFAPGLECVMCLEEFSNVETMIPFECGHPVCAGCSSEQGRRLVSCPSCRCTRRWRAAI